MEIWLRDTSAPRGDATPRRAEADDSLASDASGGIVCASCRGGVTSAIERLEVGGAFAHTFLNPAGLEFRIGCFASARARGVGAATAEFTWFAGHAWQVAVCADCAVHLGWAFSAEGSRFYGLILDRLEQLGSG